MYIQVHRRVNIENRENTLKHIYIVKKSNVVKFNSTIWDIYENFQWIKYSNTCQESW